MKQLLIMSIAMMSFLGTLKVHSQEKNARFTLENTVNGGKDRTPHYASDMEAWPCLATDEILFFNEQSELIAIGDGASMRVIATNEELDKACGAGHRFLAADNSSKIWTATESKIMQIELPGCRCLRTIDAKHDDIAIASESGWVAYTDGSDLWVADGKTAHKVNTDNTEGIAYGCSVHRNEFGISAGMFWSHEGTRLCFYRKDERSVAQYPLVDTRQRIGKTVSTRYPMAGERSEEVQIGIYDTRNGETIYLKTKSPTDRYFTNISWSFDDRQICVAEINRDQTHTEINLYNSITGEKDKTLFEEHDDCWIEPCEPALWLDESHFVWASYRDGFNHIYLYDTTNGNCRQLTKGEWCVTKILGADSKREKVIIQTNSNGYLNRTICCVNINTGRMTRISCADAVTDAIYADGHSQIICNTSSPTTAKQWSVVNVDGKEKVLKTIANPYEGFDMPQIRLVDLKSADGRYDLTGRIILPTDFDDTKKYPVIVYLYGGPHVQMVNNSYLHGAGSWMLYLAQEGYIVFTMDNRGSDKRGSAFEQSVYRQLGRCESEDQMVAVEYLRSLPYVDSQRMGIHGWSYGGFMTLTMLTDYPDAFRAGVAGGPVCDWRYYEVMYGERYMDTPQQNPKGYESTSICNKIGKLKSKLLLIQGAMDSTVVWQHSLMLTNKAIEQGIFFDQFVYPNHPHNVRGHDRVHLIGLIKEYFDTWLK